MGLEIKILDLGDIELESSFLVLGRDCGRTRRVPTLGFLILGGAFHAALAPLGPAAEAAIFRDTAARVYRLD